MVVDTYEFAQSLRDKIYRMELPAGSKPLTANYIKFCGAFVLYFERTQELANPVDVYDIGFFHPRHEIPEGMIYLNTIVHEGSIFVYYKKFSKE